MIKYVKHLADSLIAVKNAVPDADTSVQEELLKKTSALLSSAQKALNTLKEKDAQAARKEQGSEQANYFHKEVVPAMEALRAPIDELEMLVDKALWPVPTYGDLLFEV